MLTLPTLHIVYQLKVNVSKRNLHILLIYPNTICQCTLLHINVVTLRCLEPGSVYNLYAGFTRTYSLAYRDDKCTTQFPACAGLGFHAIPQIYLILRLPQKRATVFAQGPINTSSDSSHLCRLHLLVSWRIELMRALIKRIFPAY